MSKKHRKAHQKIKYPFLLLNFWIKHTDHGVCQGCGEPALFSIAYYYDVERLLQASPGEQQRLADQMALQEENEQNCNRHVVYVRSFNCETCTTRIILDYVGDAVYTTLLDGQSSLTALPGSIVMGEAILSAQGPSTTFATLASANTQTELVDQMRKTSNYDLVSA